MAFDSGVKGYVIGKATVTVYFPIDWKDNADISCRQCPYYSAASRFCHLNHSMVEYPDKYVGSNCPLEREEVVDAEDGTDNDSRSL